ncbi:MAG TPA: hypothetical protein QGI59_01010 [Candidatus Poseidoniia archaeon]|jgi:hypothetical protein|nr:hypothetical protein [Candidatus Poseidoniia archaeon]
MIDEQIFRRFNHTIAACFVIYFLFPAEILGLHRSYFIILFWLLVVAIETARLTKGIKILGMRDYEKERIASFVWFASGSCLLLGLYEMGFFPQSLVIATIVMAAYTDPVIGEATKEWGDKNGIICGLACSFIIYQFIVGNLIYSIIGSIVAVISERPKIKWFDDDLAMQIVPMIILVILNWLELLPDLVKDGVIIGGGI